MVTIANVHDSKAAYLLMRVLKEMCSGVKIILADGGYLGELVDNIRKNSDISFKLLSVHTKSRDSDPFKRDGLWKEHSHGWITTEDSAETMNKHSIRQRKWSNWLL